MSALRFGRVLKGREQSKRETLLKSSPRDTVISGNVIDVPHDEEISCDLESHEEIPHDEHVMTASETHDREHVLPPDERVTTPRSMKLLLRKSYSKVWTNGTSSCGIRDRSLTADR